MQPYAETDTHSVTRFDWHADKADDVAHKLETDTVTGLTPEQVEFRLAEVGPNTLQTIQQVRWHAVLARQFFSALILILFVAAGISLAVGEVADAITILVIILLNSALGFFQEWRAEHAIQALQRMLSVTCTVTRDGREKTIDAEQLVPGDIALLDTGERVPADLRLADVINLKVDESSLTGESVAVSKNAEPVPPESSINERTSMAWMGTTVMNGRGTGVVVATGMNTEFGRIATLTQTVGDETTPLQRKLGALGQQLGALSIGVSIVIVLLGWLLGKPLLDMFLTGVSLAVAVVPEGLPVVVTITLALGVRAMVGRNALLRRLQAAETLGAASVICTDKTGTLTENEMMVQRIWLPSGELSVAGVGYEPVGDFASNGHTFDPTNLPDLMALLETGLRCNHADISFDGQEWRHTGEPTEAALVVAAHKAGLNSEKFPDVTTEFSFNSGRKRMTIVEETPAGLLAHVKGAPEVILERCARVSTHDGDVPMTSDDRETAAAAYVNLARQGLRTLAIARRRLADDVPLNEDSVERDMTLLGIVGIIDPPRPEVKGAIRLATSAGIQVVMMTGDAPETALAIAHQVGMDSDRAIHGRDLDQLGDDQLLESLRQKSLFARTTPEQKMRIVTLLQELGHIVGMTGDGVNDAPALKKADIGISMGIRGTEVARGASDMVLLDDNFASIIGAIHEGRRQYDNIQKFVRYLLSSNAAELIAILLNIVVGGPLILLPVQILWMNLVTDGATAVALGAEKADRGTMQRPPRSPEERILNRSGMLTVALLGAYMGCVTLWLFHHYLDDGPENSLLMAQTVAFTGLILLEKMNVFNFRSLHEPLTTVGFLSNPWILVAWSATVGLQVAAVYVPFLQSVLHTTALGWEDWGLILLVAAPVLIAGEVYKFWQGRIASS